MRGFLKILLASLTAIAITLAVLFFLGVSFVNNATHPAKPEVKPKTVLVIDLSKPVMEQGMDAGLAFPEGRSAQVTGLFDMVRAIKQAGTDPMVNGIYLQCRKSSLGFAGSTELREALLAFKKTGKFIIAYADYISERAYNVAIAADHIYCQPGGGLDWQGYSMQVTFFKGALDKLEIKPEIFYAGQFKSATEPYRYAKMSEPNRLQMTAFLEDLYQQTLVSTASARGIDTATLRHLANTYSIRNAGSALGAGLTDGAKYDDEVKDSIKSKLGLGKKDKVNFMPIGDYIKNGRWKECADAKKIAIIYAEGEIVDGSGSDEEIGGDRFRTLVRKARMDTSIKALVLRINSPGGSSLACEGIWRELVLLKKEKPLVISMGNYAASGGYYIACMADSIFAQPNTLTGSIGVFSLYFNTQLLFNNKLGITFDGVKTAPYADMYNTNRPMAERERQIGQEETDSIYTTFKERVALGRKLDMAYVDSIAQGRVWSGQKAWEIKLVDRIGSMQDALDCAARLANIKDFQVYEWPEVQSFLQQLLGGDSEDQKNNLQAYSLKQQLGEKEFELFSQYKRLKQMVGVPQMRLPFFDSFK